jgi:integrase
MAKRKPTGFQWKKMPTPFHGKEYRVWGDVDGKRKQFWFATEKEAKAVCADRNQERDAYGSKVNLDSEARLEAFRAAQLLEGSGKSILDAVRFYLEHQKRVSVPGPFSELAAKVRAEFKRRLEKNEVSDRHSESLNETLKKLEARFGDQVVSEINTEEIREWLIGLPLATKTRNKHRGYAGQVFNLAVDYGYLPANPVSKIKRFNKRSTEDDEISILSAAETERLFRAADPAVIPFLTLSFFCGVRVATLERLSWADVKFEERRVIVPRYKGKNQKRYPVTLSENAQEWLRPYVRKSGSLLVPATSINRPGAIFGSPSRTATRKLILAAAQRAEVTLPDNAGRHTFISMHVAAYESLDKTATESDNSPALIKSNYLGIVTREDAKKFWEIRPGNV